MSVVNSTERFPKALKPGMQVQMVSTDSLARNSPDQLLQLESIARGPVRQWHKSLAGARGLNRLKKMVTLLFGSTRLTEHVKLEDYGNNENYSIVSIRVPRNVYAIKEKS